MSEQEETTGGTAASGQSVVMVESGARHKQPYRPTELQDEALPDLHHKRSRAPAVPSVAEELKAASETTGTIERKESESAMSSDKHKSSAAKKLSSNTKRRVPSPEAITLAPLEVDSKRAALSPLPQPIPAQVESMLSIESDASGKFGADNKDDDDSIKEEIAELRTPTVVNPSSEWHDINLTDVGDENTEINVADENSQPQETIKEELLEDGVTSQQEVKEDLLGHVNIPHEEKEPSPEIKNFSSQGTKEGLLERSEKREPINAKNIVDDKHIKKKEISWNDKEYLQTVHLQEMGVRSYAWSVERKASVGPYFHSTPSFGGPSGITICIPKKSKKGLNEDLNAMPSVINITVSKKNIVNRFASQGQRVGKDKLDLKIGDAPNATFLGALRGRINDIRDKIRNRLNM